VQGGADICVLEETLLCNAVVPVFWAHAMTLLGKVLYKEKFINKQISEKVSG